MWFRIHGLRVTILAPFLYSGASCQQLDKSSTFQDYCTAHSFFIMVYCKSHFVSFRWFKAFCFLALILNFSSCAFLSFFGKVFALLTVADKITDWLSKVKHVFFTLFTFSNKCWAYSMYVQCKMCGFVVTR